MLQKSIQWLILYGILNQNKHGSEVATSDLDLKLEIDLKHGLKALKLITKEDMEERNDLIPSNALKCSPNFGSKTTP